MRVQARITLPASLRAGIDALRARWNPEVATGNPAHLTVVYHDEAPDAALLCARLERACAETPRFELALGPVRRFTEPLRGAFAEVLDPSDGVARLRRRVLAPPFAARERYGLHVTLLHPSQGERLAAAWSELATLEPGAAFAVEAIELIEGIGAATTSLAAFALAGG